MKTFFLAVFYIFWIECSSAKELSLPKLTGPHPIGTMAIEVHDDTRQMKHAFIFNRTHKPSKPTKYCPTFLPYGMMVALPTNKQ